MLYSHYIRIMAQIAVIPIIVIKTSELLSLFFSGKTDLLFNSLSITLERNSASSLFGLFLAIALRQFL